MNKTTALLMALPLTISQLANATETTDAAQWSGSSELGYVSTDGNTKTRTINFKLDINRESSQWRHNYHLEALNTSEEESTSAEKYLTSWKSDYKFNEHDYMFGLISYEDDRFSGFEYQANLGLGYGRRVINNETHILALEIGPGYRISEPEVGEEQDEATLRGALAYDWKISDTATFEQDLSVESGSENTISKSITALSAQIVGKLAMKLSYTVKYTEEVPAGSKHADSETAITLVYAF